MCGWAESMCELLLLATALCHVTCSLQWLPMSGGEGSFIHLKKDEFQYVFPVSETRVNLGVYV